MKKLVTVAIGGLCVLAVSQLTRSSIPARPAIAEVQAPPEVLSILKKDCYSCHSDQRRLQWFDEVVPVYWLVRHDVLTARKYLNFSTLGSEPAAVQRATLFEAVNMIQLGTMPLPQFVRLHPQARVTPQELAVLKNYLAPWKASAQPSAAVQTAHAAPVTLSSVRPEWNGLAFDSSFERWSLLSVTDRGDNNTFRFILGNDVAIKALETGNISPWPDGTEFAKVAWQQTPGSDGLVRIGSFVQVELMKKDASQYKATEGWGWGRWRGIDLKPYGSNADFVNECTACHRPLRGNDYVYTMPMAATNAPGAEIVNNRAANFGPALLPLNWEPMTLVADRKTGAIAVLYRNINSLALVTWNERDDPHWFGARIPDQPVSLETLEVAPTGEGSLYRRFNNAGQLEYSPPGAFVRQRMSLLQSLAPAQLP